MKILSIPARAKTSVKLTKSALAELPKQRLAVLTTAQHIHKIKDVAEQIETDYFGQVLGCNVLNAIGFSKFVDAFFERLRHLISGIRFPGAFVFSSVNNLHFNTEFIKQIFVKKNVSADSCQ